MLTECKVLHFNCTTIKFHHYTICDAAIRETLNVFHNYHVKIHKLSSDIHPMLVYFLQEQHAFSIAYQHR